MASIYSTLKPVVDVPQEMYEGFWNGKPVKFERVFRGYRFSDAECEALCRGESLEVHGLTRNGVKYSVLGGLHESQFTGYSSVFSSVKFKAESTIPFNSEYRFESRHGSRDSAYEPYEPVVQSKPPVEKETAVFDKHVASPAALEQPYGPMPVVDKYSQAPSLNEVSEMTEQEFLNTFNPDMPNKPMVEMNAELEAMVSSSSVPPILRVSEDNELTKFIPVLDLLSEDNLLKVAKAALAEQSGEEENPNQKFEIIYPPS